MPHVMKIAFQMDPMETINVSGDSSFVLIEEAQRRGHSVFHYLPEDLSYENGKVRAYVKPIRVDRTATPFFTADDPISVDLEADMDMIFMRQDPPFDMAYITATHLLELIHPRTFVVNNPVSVRNAPEKLLVTQFADLMPPTLITRRTAEIEAFRAVHGEIVVKPLFGMGGRGVFHLSPSDPNLASLLEMFFEKNREPIMVQRFLSEVRGGDKRIILIDGEPAGALNRVPAEGEVRSNLVVGGRAEKSTLTDREKEICARLKPLLQREELLFVGIDVIGDWLTEINVTSPTGLQGINQFDGVQLEAQIMDAAEKHARERS